MNYVINKLAPLVPWSSLDHHQDMEATKKVRIGAVKVAHKGALAGRQIDTIRQMEGNASVQEGERF